MQQQEPASPRNIQYIGIARRLGAFAYDLVLLFAILMLAGSIPVLISGEAMRQNNIPYALYILLVIFLFFGWFWVHGGQTLGMRAWQIRLEQENGQNLSWLQAALRFCLASMSFGIGLLWCLKDKQKRALYDQLARTRIIRVEKKYVPPA